MRPNNSVLSAAGEKQLGSYALAVATGVGVLTNAQVSHANIKYYDINQTANNSSVALPFGNLTIVQSGNSFSHQSRRDMAGATTLPNSASATRIIAMGNYGTNLGAGAAISAGKNFIVPSLTTIGNFVEERRGSGYHLSIKGNFSGVTGYLGFSFSDRTAARYGQTDYGWVQISVSGPYTSVTVIDGAWETDGGPIAAGQTMEAAVPESSSVGLLAAGACAVGLWRRQARQRRLERAAGRLAEVSR